MENKSQALMKKQSDALIAFDFKVPVQPSGTKKQKVLSEDAFAQVISNCCVIQLNLAIANLYKMITT